MRPFRLRCHAKINPFLAIGPTRTDGLHEIITIMQLISLHDELLVEPSSEFGFVCSDPRLDNDQNLVLRAASLLKEYIELPPVRLTLRKEIPPCSGLGGGSSNVAGSLLAINLSLGSPLQPEALAEIAAAVSSDAPFFLSSSATAGCEGRGEIVSPLPPFDQVPLVVAMPEVEVSTREAYAKWDALPAHPALPVEADPLTFRNDFEIVAPQESMCLIERLRAEGAKEAHLCGSGSAVFGMFDELDDAIQIARTLRREGYWAHPAHTLKEKPAPEWIS
ncbi:MAG: 4-(cytidine 5'-diphospho)-2-C-methyl-D-erythritol kinase [Armatimonadota bacterium]